MRCFCVRLAGRGLVAATSAICLLPILAAAQDGKDTPRKDDSTLAGWAVLLGAGGLEAWKSPTTNWQAVADVSIDPQNPKKFVGKEGSSAYYNGPGGRGSNLITKEQFGDVEVHLEFNVPKGSNSGIKLEGVYEIQIFDSFGTKKLDGSSNGGVYPRAEFLPKYHHIDDGYAPKTNASRAPGEWQTLDIKYRAPRFDAEGKKTQNAQFESVILNGTVIHEKRDLPCPTGNAWRGKEQPKGPILLQGDHGPVAFRNVRVRPL